MFDNANNDDSRDLQLEEFYEFVNDESLKNKIKIIHMNIRSLNANFIEFEHFLHYIKVDIDFIVLSECWLQNIQLYENVLNGYGMICSEKMNKSGGIVAFYKKSVAKLIDVEKNVLEGCDSLFMCFETHNSKPLNLLAIYRSPSEAPALCINSLDKFLKSEKLMGIIGDLNLCFKKHFTDINVENLYDLLLGYGYLPIISTPTRITTTTSSLIDQIFLNHEVIEEYEMKHGNVDVNITDHKLQYLIMNVHGSIQHSKQKRPLIRTFNSKNTDFFVNRLKKLNFEELTTENNVSSLYEDLMNQLIDIYNQSFPTVQISRKKSRNKQWFDKNCQLAFKKKVKLYKKHQLTQCDEDKRAYEFHNKYYRKLIKVTKNNYNKNIIENCTGSKDLWKVVNNFLGKSRTKRVIKLKINENVVTDDITIANIMNKNFNEVGNIYGRTPTAPNSHLQFFNARTTDSFYFEDITYHEVKNILTKLDDSKSSNDLIPLKVFKKIPDNIIKRLTCLFNTSIYEGVFPDQLKYSKIIPVYKQGSVYDCNNYRPISLLSSVDKIIEKAVCSRIHDFLKKTNFFCVNQYGFRANHNTELALLSLTDRIYKAIDSKHFVVLLSIDLRKAFDVIRHDILLDKLENAGIRGFMLKWFQSYLSNRYHQTIVNGTESDVLKVQYGVPQGSSLGPLLYLIYFNDVQNIFNDSELNVFADDTCLITTNERLDDALKDMNHKIKTFEKFISANGIKINSTKTEYVILYPKGMKIDTNERLCYNDEEIKMKNEIKVLGLIIDRKLSFKSHVQSMLKKKLRKYLSIIFRMRQFMNLNCLLKIYFSHIHSLLSYCILVYGLHCEANIDIIERFQIRIFKLIFRASTQSIYSILKKNRLLSFRQILKYKLLTLAHLIKYDRDKVPHYFKDLYQTKSHTTLRNKMDYLTPYYRTSIGQRSIEFIIAKEWNPLPENMKMIQNSKTFKTAVKTLLTADYRPKE